MEDLPLLSRTPDSWAALAAAHLDEFLADHAVCEQQAAQSALALVGHYPEDDELVDRMTALAAEEIRHLRRVVDLLRARGRGVAKRRPNPYVKALRAAIGASSEPALQVDRLLVSALIEARSCERFTRLREALPPGDVRELLDELGPAEARHWRIFHALASRHATAETLESRFRQWLEIEAATIATLGVRPTVHG